MSPNRLKTITSREFNQHVSRAKRAAKEGPVVITERGKPAFVLMDHAQYERLPEGRGPRANPLELLSDPAATDGDVEFPRMRIGFRAVDAI